MGDLTTRVAIKNLCNSTKNLRILGECGSLKRTIKLVHDTDPKLILFDEKLNDSSGYDAIIKMMKSKPTSTLLFINRDKGEKKPQHIKALDYSIVGTIEFEIVNSEFLHQNQILSSIRILSKLNINKFRFQINKLNEYEIKPIVPTKKKVGVKPNLDKIRGLIEDTSLSNVPKSILTEDHTLRRSPYNELVVIGASTGGPRLLIYVISQFPVNFPPVLIVQHMPPGTVGPFAERMNRNARIDVKLAEEGDIIQRGMVYIAPGGYHMEIERDKHQNKVIRITSGPLVNFVKPAVDVTLFSAARIYKKNVLAFILTGMGHDGREGCRTVKKMGGRIFALNEEDSVIYGMNKSVIEAGLTDKILGMDEIVTQIAKEVNYQVVGVNA
jgi:two-component system chemotaxis response regulator CheB